jgi:hypothetical protein
MILGPPSAEAGLCSARLRIVSKSSIYFSASMAFPVLRWPRRWSGEAQGIHEPAMLPDLDFRMLSWNHKTGFARHVEYFVEVELTKRRLPSR